MSAAEKIFIAGARDMTRGRTYYFRAVTASVLLSFTVKALWL